MSCLTESNINENRKNFFNFAFVFAFILLIFPFTAFAAQLDWDANSWAPTGSLSQTYNIGGSNINFNFSDPNSGLTTVPDGSPGSPETNAFQHGGTNENGLFVRTNFSDVFNHQITLTIDFTHPGGVSDISFTIFDIDAGSPQWIDEVVITATDGSSTFNPSLITTGPANTIINPSTVRGTAGSSSSSPNGNASFTFNQTNLTRVTIVYRNVTGTSQPPNHNQWISIHDINFDVAPTVAKQFIPNSIISGGTSTVTITLGNNDTNTATLTADLVDTLPAGVTVANPANIGGTCPGTTNAPIGGSTITYTNGSTIPAGGCTITVDVTSSTVGTVTNSIAAGDLQTNRGSNPAAANDDLTVTAPPVPTCPPGTTLISQTGNADSASGTGPTQNPSNATGPMLPVGTTANLGNSARVRFNAVSTLTLDLTDTVPTNGIIVISIARDNNGGNVLIEDSPDGSVWSGTQTFNAGPNDSLQRINYTVTSATGARFLRFTRQGGRVWIDGVEYSQICQAIPVVDLSITKDDSSATYTPGGTGTYVLTITNNGPDAVTGAAIQDNLPSGVTLSASWTCSATAGSSCSAASGGSAGDSSVSLTADVLNTGVVTVNIPVQFSANPNDY